MFHEYGNQFEKKRPFFNSLDDVFNILYNDTLIGLVTFLGAI